MKRRNFLGSMAIGSTALGTAAQSMAARGTNSGGQELVVTPAVVMAPRADGVEIVWAVSKLARGKVEWESADGEKGVAAANAFGLAPQGEEIIRVRLDGLRPGTRYRFRAHTFASADGNSSISAWRSFKTLDPAAATSSFAVWNDTHEHAATIKALHTLTPASDFLLWNGDTCNNWMQANSLVPTLLHPAGQDITAERPLFLTWGNHDVRGPWAFKAPEMVASPNGRPFYAFRSGPVAVICLHTGEDKPDHHPSFGGRVAFDLLRKEQAAWLQKVITSPEMRAAPYRIVFCHIPLRWTEESHLEESDYAAGAYDYFSRRCRDAWHDALVAWGTQVVISGHTHQATYLPGTLEHPYAQLTGGGPRPEEATWIEGDASAAQLTLTVQNLAGVATQRAVFQPVT